MSKKISLGKKKYPTKTSLNMAMREKSPLSPVKVIPSLVLLLIAIGIFSKFAVVDRLYSVYLAQQDLELLQNQVELLNQELAGYDQVKERHSRYSSTHIPAEDQKLLPRSQLLDIVEHYLLPAARVNGVTLSNNLISMELENIDLDGMSLVVQQLSALPEVANVEVYTINKGGRDAQDVPRVSMLLTLHDRAVAEPAPQEDAAVEEGAEG